MSGLDVQERAPEELGIDVEALAAFLAATGPVAVVDLETTGLQTDPGAELLEFGAVLLEPGREGATVAQTLVRPSGPLPRAIQRLTGLCDADVADAPGIAAVTPDMAAALDGRTVIAHNAEFERHFLARFVSSSLDAASYLDTQDLLAMTHPDAPDLRLESFTRRLLDSEERHRALDDALDTARVLSRIALGAVAGEPRYAVARNALESYAPDSPWLPILAKSLVAPDGAGAEPFVAIGDSAEPRVSFDEDEIAAALGDVERGRRHFAGYRVRPEQIDLARHFVRVLQRGGRILIEGGTGVGKSLAYLAAAIPFVMERARAGARDNVVVSTRTKLLQDQLLQKDIPAAAAFLGHPELQAMSIKGRANYACARRLRGVLAEGRDLSIFAEDRHAYAALLACARTRPHGEIGALPPGLLRRFPRLRELRRRAVAARAEHCSREECAAETTCPFGRRRAALSDAHLVVANHDLLLRWPPDYPRLSHAIVDETHELVGVADEVYALEVRPAEVLSRLDDLFGRPSERGRGGSTRGDDREDEPALLPRRARRRAERDALAWRRALQQDLVALGRSLSERASEWGELQLPPHADRILPAACELAATAADRIDQIARAAEELDGGTPGRGGPDADAQGPSPVEKTTAELRASAEALRTAFGADAQDSVAAFEGLFPAFDGWRLAIRRVSPAEPFHSAFLDRLESFAGVSASLFVQGDEFAALGELELDQHSDDVVEKVSVPSPFPYERHMRVAALPSPSGEDALVQETARVLTDVARRLGGRTLGLFTSLKRMGRAAELLAEMLREDGLDVLTPRRATDDPAALVERFCRAGGAGVLLGARTFWQGLDIPGDDLQAVVIEKLPFEVPSELSKRREGRIRARGEDAFGRYGMGKMLLNLKQMAGRLIRSEDDRGIVVIVEGRTDRRYFRRLGEAFPDGVRVQAATRQDLGRLLAEVGLPAGPSLTRDDSES